MGRTQKLKDIHQARRHARLRFAVLGMLIYYGVGVAIYRSLEGWTVIDCLYFGMCHVYVE